jgi:hypothetical protein
LQGLLVLALAELPALPALAPEQPILRPASVLPI